MGAGVKLGALAVEAALASRLDFVTVVLRPGDDGEWLPFSFAEAVSAGRAQRIWNAEAEAGMGVSLRCGLHAATKASGAEPDAAVVLLADQPFAGAALIDRLLATYRQADEPLHYCAARRDGLIHPPVLLGQALFGAVNELRGDEGARALLRGGAYAGRYIDEVREETFWDADTPGDAERIRIFFQQNDVR